MPRVERPHELHFRRSTGRLRCLFRRHLLTAGCREETSADAPPMPVPVQTCRVKQITMHPALDLVGAIVAIPERSASVSPQTGGWIKELAVTEGQSVPS